MSSCIPENWMPFHSQCILFWRQDNLLWSTLVSNFKFNKKSWKSTIVKNVQYQRKSQSQEHLNLCTALLWPRLHLNSLLYISIVRQTLSFKLYTTEISHSTDHPEVCATFESSFDQVVGSRGCHMHSTSMVFFVPFYEVLYRACSSFCQMSGTGQWGARTELWGGRPGLGVGLNCSSLFSRNSSEKILLNIVCFISGLISEFMIYASMAAISKKVKKIKSSTIYVFF